MTISSFRHDARALHERVEALVERVQRSGAGEEALRSALEQLSATVE